jgi:chaperone required for assembly of F1-ATPase
MSGRAQLERQALMAERSPASGRAKRFYREVSIREGEGGWRVLLDERPLRTPLKRPVATPHRALAEAIAAEWSAQETEIDPASMPVMRLTATAIDRVIPEREAIVVSLLAYAETDLLCYRAPHPRALHARQQALWQPLLDWVDGVHGIGLLVSDSILPLQQPAAAIEAAKTHIATLSDELLTALQAAVAGTGSLVLGLGIIHGRIGADEAFAAAMLDETYQNEHWGEDAEALERRRRIGVDLEAIKRYLMLIAS